MFDWLHYRYELAKHHREKRRINSFYGNRIREAREQKKPEEEITRPIRAEIQFLGIAVCDSCGGALRRNPATWGEGAAHTLKRRVQTPAGPFPSIKAASKAARINAHKGAKWAAQNLNGWSFIADEPKQYIPYLSCINAVRKTVLYGFPEISGQECAIDLRRYSRCQL
jgi:hypothetical protein